MNIFDAGYYTEHDLRNAGFKSVGDNVRIARKCTILGVENITIGSNVRIDDFCTILAMGGNLTVGSYIHIGGYCYLSAGSGITMEDFSGLSQGVRIYSRSDDYSGKHLTNPTVPEEYTSITCGEVILKRHVIVGSGSIILPGVAVGEGTAVGALSVVTKTLEEWGVYFGSPARKLKSRSKRLLDLENHLLKTEAPPTE